MLMQRNRTIVRPASLRQKSTLFAATLGVATLATPALAQQAEEPEVQLDTLKIKGRTADVNPYAEEGAPYKAKRSGDARRVEPLAQTPATIQVITESQIKESGRSDLAQILQMQPGVTVGTGENGNKFGDRYILRGQELKSDIFVDGLRDPGMTIRESFNVEQVELTKGPSSTFAGRGSSGGAVNAITKKATTDYNFANVDVGGGTDAFVRTTADANLRVSDSFAIRANALYASQDVPDRAPANRKRAGAALSALMKPADNFNVTVDFYHLTANDRPDLGSYFRNGVVERAIPSYSQSTDFVRSNVNVLTGKVHWEITPTLRLENTARYGQAHNAFVNTGARGATEFGTGAAVTTLDNGHQGWQDIEYLADQLNLMADARLAGMKHTITLGGEASHNRVINGTFTITNSGARNCATGTTATLNAWCASPGADNSNVMGRSFTMAPWNVDWQVNTLSAYAMDTVDVTPWLNLFGGVRLDHYTYDLKTQTSGVVTPYAYSGDLWNYHGGVTITPRDGRQFYFAFGTATNINGGESDVGANCGYGGFCAPGASTSGGSAATNANYFGAPVKTTNFELGTKWELLGDKLLLTAAAFHLTKDGVFQSCNATVDPTCTTNGYGSSGSLNTGKYQVEGLEFGLVGNITSRLSGQAGLTWMRSKILESSTPGDLGYKLSNFAGFQANAQIRYQLTDKAAIGGNVNHKSSMAAGQPDTAAGHSATTGAYTFNVPAYTTFDLFGSYKLNRHLEARVNVQNVADRDYYLAAYRGGTFVYIGDKRRISLTLSAKY